MNEQSIRWDDLQVVLAISENGSLSGAGRQLGLSHATVFRRLGEMEHRLGASLFTRTRTGYEQTAAGEDLSNTAERIRSEVHALERRIVGRDLELSGTIRLTTTDTLFAGLLAPIITRFREQHPDIEIELLISNQLYSLSKREADIAIRPTLSPPETMVGRRVADLTQAIYGQRQLWHGRQCPLSTAQLRESNWIGPDIHMGDRQLESWMAKEVDGTRCRYRIDSLLGLRAAIQAGAGIGILPLYVGEADPELLRLSAPIPELSTQLWLLTHPDMRRVARIKTFIEEAGDAIRERFAALPTQA